ncbi:hypothetical protein ELY40_06610 [Vreelandella populi]|nr:hypothetical protein ELY40_06610 [Halomonas populi]
MKSQDIVLLLKLISLEQAERSSEGLSKGLKALPSEWWDWEDIADDGDSLLLPVQEAEPQSPYSVRALARETGISKSQVSLSLQRSLDVGLARHERLTGLPRANSRVLLEFIAFGLRFAFPTKAKEITRGIATAFAAPVLEKHLFSGGNLAMVWPDARGNTKGQAVTPLAPSVPKAIRRDPNLYAMLALVDAIRLGQPRERSLAQDMLAGRLGVL